MATKLYDHAVIHNGKFYSANVPVPVEEDTDVKQSDEVAEEEAADHEDETTEEVAEKKAVKANVDKRTGGKPKTANTAD